MTKAETFMIVDVRRKTLHEGDARTAVCGYMPDQVLQNDRDRGS